MGVYNLSKSFFYFYERNKRNVFKGFRLGFMYGKLLTGGVSGVGVASICVFYRVKYPIGFADLNCVGIKKAYANDKSTYCGWA